MSLPVRRLLYNSTRIPLQLTVVLVCDYILNLTEEGNNLVKEGQQDIYYL